MEWIEGGSLEGVPIRVPADDFYRTCSVCGQDCEPDIGFGSDAHGARVTFICAEHGIQGLVDPFEGRR